MAVVTVIPILLCTKLGDLVPASQRPQRACTPWVSLVRIVDDTIHFITAYRRGLAAGYSRHAAVERSYTTVAVAATITTAIFIAGFGSLCFSEIALRHRFALLSILALLLAWIGDFFMLPALLVSLGGKPQLRRTPEELLPNRNAVSSPDPLEAGCVAD